MLKEVPEGSHPDGWSRRGSESPTNRRRAGRTGQTVLPTALVYCDPYPPTHTAQGGVTVCIVSHLANVYVADSGLVYGADPPTVFRAPHRFVFRLLCPVPLRSLLSCRATLSPSLCAVVRSVLSRSKFAV